MAETVERQSIASHASPAPQGYGPEHAQMIQMICGYWLSKAVCVAAQLGIADLLSNGARAVDELAQATKTHGPSLYRVMRALASRGVFTEVRPGVFDLTSLGRTLQSDAPGKARATAIALAGDYQWKSMAGLGFSVETGRPASREVWGKTLFGYLAEHPEEARWFGEAMVGMHGEEPAAIVAAYDFSGCRTLIDIGGGTGTLLATILQHNPQLQGVLFDMPSLAAPAERLAEAAGVAERWRFVGGDFFKNLPKGGDAYLLSHVLHDWHDEQCHAILRQCRQAIGDEGRLLIVETILPPGDAPHRAKMVDLVMLAVTGGQERTEDEYAGLLSKSGFALQRVTPTAVPDSVLEAVPA